MVNCWFGSRLFGFRKDPRKWKGLLLKGRGHPDQIPNHRAPKPTINHELMNKTSKHAQNIIRFFSSRSIFLVVLFLHLAHGICFPRSGEPMVEAAASSVPNEAEEADVGSYGSDKSWWQNSGSLDVPTGFIVGPLGFGQVGERKSAGNGPKQHKWSGFSNM